MSTNNRVIKKINLNEESNEIVIQFRGNSSAIAAKVLAFKRDDYGNMVYLLLDRLVHKEWESVFECCIDGQCRHSFNVAGCYTSEPTIMEQQ